jgi:hypothetical protein
VVDGGGKSAARAKEAAILKAIFRQQGGQSVALFLFIVARQRSVAGIAHFSPLARNSVSSTSRLPPSSRIPSCTGRIMSPTKMACGLIVLAVTAALTGAAIGAQNLDQGKSAPKLFAEGCASCHRSPRGLAKGRFQLTLYLFLQKHYSSGSSSAWALASYLESIDSGKRAATKSAASAKASRSSLRPPAPVPAR